MVNLGCWRTCDFRVRGENQTSDCLFTQLAAVYVVRRNGNYQGLSQGTAFPRPLPAVDG
jgi:hypothetical protein